MTEAEIQEIIDVAIEAYDRAKYPPPPPPPPPPPEDKAKASELFVMLDVALAQSDSMRGLLRGNFYDALNGDNGPYAQRVAGDLYRRVLAVAESTPHPSQTQISDLVDSTATEVEDGLASAGVKAWELHAPEGEFERAQAADAELLRSPEAMNSELKAAQAREVMRQVYADQLGLGPNDLDKIAPRYEPSPRYGPNTGKENLVGESNEAIRDRDAEAATAAEVMEREYKIARAIDDLRMTMTGTDATDPFGIESAHAERRRLGELAELDRWKQGGSEYPEWMQKSREAENARMRELEAEHGGNE